MLPHLVWVSISVQPSSLARRLSAEGGHDLRHRRRQLARPNDATASRPSRINGRTVDIEIDWSSAERWKQLGSICTISSAGSRAPGWPTTRTMRPRSGAIGATANSSGWVAELAAQYSDDVWPNVARWLCDQDDAWHSAHRLWLLNGTQRCFVEDQREAALSIRPTLRQAAWLIALFDKVTDHLRRDAAASRALIGKPRAGDRITLGVRLSASEPILPE